MADYDVTLWTGLNVNTGPYYLAKISGVGSAERERVSAGLPGEDGVRPGREYAREKQLILEGTIRDRDSVWNALAPFQAAWDDPSIRTVPGKLVPLQLQRPGRDPFLIYGRPGELDPDTEQADVGRFPYTASFRQMDPKHYSATEHVTVLQLATGSTTGLVMTTSGLDAPLATTAPAQRGGFVTHNGDTGTWPVITIQGATTNPEVTVRDESGALLWELRLATTLAHDQSLTLDTRPWARTVLRSDGANLSGAMTRDSWLSKSQLPPGRHEVLYSANDATGTSTCEFRFRDAFLSV